jgi:hypothetical protein
MEEHVNAVVDGVGETVSTRPDLKQLSRCLVSSSP